MNHGEILILLLGGLSLLVVAKKDGQPKGNYSLGETLVDSAITLGLMYWAGLFH